MYRLLPAVMLLLSANSVLAGLVFEIETRDLTTNPPTMERTLVYAEGQLLKMENGDQRGRSDAIVFRGDRREMLLVDHERQSYMVIDRQFVDRMVGQLQQAMGQMQGMLDKLPPDQRAMVEQMGSTAPGMGAPQAKPQVVVQRTGKREQVYGYPCELYNILRDGRKVRSVWVTNWANIRGSNQLSQTFGAMSEFFNELTSALPMQGAGPVEDNVFATLNQLGGFPVATLEYSADGRVESESALRSAKQQRVDPQTFAAPTNYQPESMPTGMPGAQAGNYGQGRR